jgi:hypothetical protein
MRKGLICVLLSLFGCGGTEVPVCPDGASVVDVVRGGWCCRTSGGVLHGPLDMAGDQGEWQTGSMNMGEPCGYWHFSSGEEAQFPSCPF